MVVNIKRQVNNNLRLFTLIEECYILPFINVLNLLLKSLNIRSKLHMIISYMQ